MLLNYLLISVALLDLPFSFVFIFVLILFFQLAIYLFIFFDFIPPLYFLFLMMFLHSMFALLFVVVYLYYNYELHQVDCEWTLIIILNLLEPSQVIVNIYYDFWFLLFVYYFINFKHLIQGPLLKFVILLNFCWIFNLNYLF